MSPFPPQRAECSGHCSNHGGELIAAPAPATKISFSAPCARTVRPSERTRPWFCRSLTRSRPNWPLIAPGASIPKSALQHMDRRAQPPERPKPQRRGSRKPIRLPRHYRPALCRPVIAPGNRQNHPTRHPSRPAPQSPPNPPEPSEIARDLAQTRRSSLRPATSPQTGRDRSSAPHVIHASPSHSRARPPFTRQSRREG